MRENGSSPAVVSIHPGRKKKEKGERRTGSWKKDRTGLLPLEVSEVGGQVASFTLISSTPESRFRFFSRIFPFSPLIKPIPIFPFSFGRLTTHDYESQPVASWAFNQECGLENACFCGHTSAICSLINNSDALLGTIYNRPTPGRQTIDPWIGQLGRPVKIPVNGQPTPSIANAQLQQPGG